MGILVAILIIALIAAAAYVAYTAMQRKRQAAAPGIDHHRGAAPVGRRDRGAVGGDSMAAAVADHAQATDPHEVVAAEHRLQANARNVASGLQANANATEQRRSADQTTQNGSSADPRAGGYADPATDPRHAGANGAVDPANDPRYSADPRQDGQVVDPATDPRYEDPRYDGRLAGDFDPRSDDRPR